jgi:nickel-dependent lactate racemase
MQKLRRSDRTFKHGFDFGGHKSAIVALCKEIKLYLVSKLPEEKARRVLYSHEKRAGSTICSPFGKT